MSRVIVIGGGAAGFFAALRAKALQASLDVCILEAAARPLGKVRISGGGRCNVTHACFEVDRLIQFYPRGEAHLRPVLERFMPQDTVRWFESRGVAIKTEADGRMFPTTDDSETICACLMQEARRLGIPVLTQHPARRLMLDDGRYVVETPQGSRPADAVVLACGSARFGYGAATAMEHTVVPPVPSLFTFNIRDPRLEGLAGISLPLVRGRLQDIEQEGPLLITHWGLSGPAILRLSAWGARWLHGCGYRGELLLDLCPALPAHSILHKLLEQKSATPKKQIDTLYPIEMPRRLWQKLVEAAGIPPAAKWATVSHAGLQELARSLKQASFAIEGKGVFKEEFVTAGGVPLDEIDLETMESRRSPGLYLVGEVINVDGLTGGFNFQNAWATGWIAGESIASRSPP